MHVMFRSPPAYSGPRNFKFKFSWVLMIHFYIYVSSVFCVVWYLRVASGITVEKFTKIRTSQIMLAFRHCYRPLCIRGGGGGTNSLYVLTLELKSHGKRACSKKVIMIMMMIIIIIIYIVLKTVIPTDAILRSALHFRPDIFLIIIFKPKLRFCKTNCGLLQML
jgi:hypothetical protein